MIADMLCNKKLDPTGIELLMRFRKLNISFIFIIQHYFAVIEIIRMNSTQTNNLNYNQTRASTNRI